MAQNLDEKAYLIDRGWRCVYGDWWRRRGSEDHQSIRKDSVTGEWMARTLEGHKLGLICTGPDPITCFITVESF